MIVPDALLEETSRTPAAEKSVTYRPEKENVKGRV